MVICPKCRKFTPHETGHCTQCSAELPPLVWNILYQDPRTLQWGSVYDPAGQPEYWIMTVAKREWPVSHYRNVIVVQYLYGECLPGIEFTPQVCLHIDHDGEVRAERVVGLITVSAR